MSKENREQIKRIIENLCSNYKYSERCWKGGKVIIPNYLLDYDLLNFKRENNYKIFYPILPNDSQEIFELFNLKKYISHAKFIELDKILGKIYRKNKKSNKIINLKVSPHYKYLNNDKTPYIEYMKLDRHHSVKKYDKLIKTLDRNTIFENINYITIEVKKRKDHYVITRGFHRACIYLKNNIKFIRCIIH